jgi:hypothetical protein
MCAHLAKGVEARVRILSELTEGSALNMRKQ